MALTSKKRAFIVAVREGASNKDAAIAAGCSEKTASAAGSRLAKGPDVIRELHKLNALFPVNADVKADVKTSVKASKSERPVRAPAVAVLRTECAARPSIDGDEDPLSFFKSMMADEDMDPKLRLDAAKALASFTVSKPGEKGKKEQVQEAAEQVASGRFGLRKPGQLRAVK
jgi:phage terminase small subunit